MYIFQARFPCLDSGSPDWKRAKEIYLKMLSRFRFLINVSILSLGRRTCSVLCGIIWSLYQLHGVFYTENIINTNERCYILNIILPTIRHTVRKPSIKTCPAHLVVSAQSPFRRVALRCLAVMLRIEELIGSSCSCTSTQPKPDEHVSPPSPSAEHNLNSSGRNLMGLAMCTLLRQIVLSVAQQRDTSLPGSWRPRSTEARAAVWG